MCCSLLGTGSSTESGDGGNALNAGVPYASSCWGDTLGNLFISEYANQKIRKVDTAGIISTFASDTGSAYTIWGNRDGVIYAPAYNFNLVYQFTGKGTRSTFAGGGALDAGSGCAATSAVSVSNYLMF